MVRCQLVLLSLAACGSSGKVDDLAFQEVADLAAETDLASGKDSGRDLARDVPDLSHNVPDLARDVPDMTRDDDLAPVDGQVVMQIPDPGSISLNGFWSIPNGGDMGAAGSRPELAYPAGPISSSPGYIGTDAVPGGAVSGYFVFKTLANFNNPFIIFWGTDGTVDLAHVHDGAGLVFGAAIPPESTGVNTASWHLETDHIYVLEVHVTGATFF